LIIFSSFSFSKIPAAVNISFAICSVVARCESSFFLFLFLFVFFLFDDSFVFSFASFAGGGVGVAVVVVVVIFMSSVESRN